MIFSVLFVSKGIIMVLTMSFNEAETGGLFVHLVIRGVFPPWTDFLNETIESNMGNMHQSI